MVDPYKMEEDSLKPTEGYHFTSDPKNKLTIQEAVSIFSEIGLGHYKVLGKGSILSKYFEETEIDTLLKEGVFGFDLKEN